MVCGIWTSISFCISRMNCPDQHRYHIEVVASDLCVFSAVIQCTLLFAAAFWGFADIIKTLLDSGCNVNHQNEGSLWTPLHAATFQEHGKVT